MKKKYRFGMVLSTAVGNSTRFAILQKYASRDPEVDFVWAPVKHYLAPNESNPFKLFPGRLQSRAIVILQAWPVLGNLRSFDALLIHMYEVDILTAIRSYVFDAPPRIVNTDDAPVVDPATYPIYPDDVGKPAWKRAIRLTLDKWRARRADFLIPFSTWAADIHVRHVGIPAERVAPIHLGVDLEHWTNRTRLGATNSTRPMLLFVGGEFKRKGGYRLLDVFKQRFAERADLHLVTRQALPSLPANVFVHDNLNAQDGKLKALYQQADILVLPTTCDLSPWVILEAMASGCAVIATRMAGISDMVEDGRTGVLLPLNDDRALERAIADLIDDPAKRRSMGREGRERVEREFDAAVNVPKILQTMKSIVDGRRGRSAGLVERP